MICTYMFMNNQKLYIRTYVMNTIVICNVHTYMSMQCVLLPGAYENRCIRSSCSSVNYQNFIFVTFHILWHVLYG